MDNKLQVLIVDDNAHLRSRINDYLCTREGIAGCDCVTNGVQALKVLTEKRYDIVLMDIVLQQVDGFGILEELNQREIMPKVIVISALSQDDIVRRVCELGAYYYIIKPFHLETLYNRIVEGSVPIGGERPLNRPQYTQILADPMHAPTLQSPAYQTAAAPAQSPFVPSNAYKSLDERIANVFLAVGIPAHIKGYHFLREAVKLVYHDRSAISSITKTLYPSVARAFDTTASKVERAIRHAIEVSWSRGKIENVNGIFGYTIYNSHEKPTNGEFIALVADKLSMDDLSRTEQSSSALAV